MEYTYGAIALYFVVIAIYNAYKLGEYQKPTLEYGIIREIPYEAVTLRKLYIQTEFGSDQDYYRALGVPKEVYLRRIKEDVERVLLDSAKDFIEIESKPDASFYDKRFEARLTVYRPKK